MPEAAKNGCPRQADWKGLGREDAAAWRPPPHDLNFMIVDCA